MPLITLSPFPRLAVTPCFSTDYGVPLPSTSLVLTASWVKHSFHVVIHRRTHRSTNLQASFACAFSHFLQVPHSECLSKGISFHGFFRAHALLPWRASFPHSMIGHRVSRMRRTEKKTKIEQAKSLSRHRLSAGTCTSLDMPLCLARLFLEADKKRQWDQKATPFTSQSRKTAHKINTCWFSTERGYNFSGT